MKTQILSIFFFILIGFSIIAAQEPVKQVSGGVLNGKATTMAKPVYPAAARAVNAEGSVAVQVVIDEFGNIASANAVSGHPLLRQAAVEAALQSKFSPTQLSGQPVKVSGVIVYNFVADKSNWVKTGYDLASLERVPTLNFFNVNSVAKNLQTDWTTEHEQLKRLEALKQAESAAYSETVVADERKISETREKTGEGAEVRKMIVERSVKSPNPPNAEQVAVAQNLISSLQGRLAGDPTANWQFNLGVTLSRAMSNVRNQNELKSSLDSLRRQLADAPDGTAPDYAETVRKIIAILEMPNPGDQERQQIGQLMPRLFKN